MIEIISGDDVVIPVTLKKDNATFSIPNTATIKAAIIDKGHTTLLTKPVTVDRLEAGSNWAQSLIVIKIPSAMTEGVRPQMAKIEIEVNDNGKKTWHISDVTISKGLIR